MTQYEKLLEEVKKLRCPYCHGQGEKDDADLGDISFNKWECTKCSGTGFKNMNIYGLIPE